MSSRAGGRRPAQTGQGSLDALGGGEHGLDHCLPGQLERDGGQAARQPVPLGPQPVQLGGELPAVGRVPDLGGKACQSS